jgi:hypothetical protein
LLYRKPLKGTEKQSQKAGKDERRRENEIHEIVNPMELTGVAGEAVRRHVPKNRGT